MGTRPLFTALWCAYAIDRAPALARLRAGAHLVPGRGNKSPRWAFVGEAPGATEDRLRKPFCGASGRLLDELLASVGLGRGDVYITNVVKYRPPGNRDPMPDEKAASLPYLRRELKLLGKPYVVTLGRHALDSLLPGAGIAQVHGQWQASEHGALLPLYHPAVGLYKRSMRATLFEDFKQVLEEPSL